MLANSIGLNYNHLRPIVGNTLVNIRVLTSAGMVVVRNGCHLSKFPEWRTCYPHLCLTVSPSRMDNCIMFHWKEMQLLTKKGQNLNK